MTIHEHELRAYFDDLHAEEAGTAPSFGSMRAGLLGSELSSTRATRRLPRVWWLAAAAAVVVAAGIIALRARAERRPALVQIDPSILNWSSPTDGLLQAARRLTSVSPGGL